MMTYRFGRNKPVVYSSDGHTRPQIHLSFDADSRHKAEALRDVLQIHQRAVVGVEIIPTIHVQECVPKEVGPMCYTPQVILAPAEYHLLATALLHMLDATAACT